MYENLKSYSVAGVDEDVIVAILVKRNNEQRQKIKVVYEATAGEVSKKNSQKTELSNSESTSCV